MECLPWLPDGRVSAKYCLHSPPLAEGQSCDYGQKIGPCEAGLFCDGGLCQGTVIPSQKTLIPKLPNSWLGVGVQHSVAEVELEVVITVMDPNPDPSKA